MEWVWELFSSLIWIFAVALLVAKKRGIKPEDAEKFAQKMKSSGMDKFSKLQQYAKSKTESAEAESVFESDESKDEIPSARVPVSTLGKLFKEDRNNDWLARQMKEERKRTVWNNFSDLGAQHDAVCDAKVLRVQHHLRHEENVVDDGMI